MKYKRFLEDINIKKSLFSNGSPRKMDENANLRLNMMSRQNSTPVFSPFSVKTPKLVFKNELEIKRSKELKKLNHIMKDCDELHKDNLKAIQQISIFRRQSDPIPRLTGEERRRIEHHKLLLD